MRGKTWGFGTHCCLQRFYQRDYFFLDVGLGFLRKCLREKFARIYVQSFRNPDDCYYL